MRCKDFIHLKGTRLFLALLLVSMGVHAQKLNYGVEQEADYLSVLEGKRVAVVAHAASIANGEHTVDRLLRNGIDVKFVFVPEHGFRGTASAGEKVADARDSASGLRLVSLYGSHKKPTEADLRNVDVVVYDLQDLSIRFYTYVSTLAYVMESCAEYGKTLVVLDRPTPFANVVDGPVLDTAKFRSFVGLHPVPILYGLTSGEYAKMVKGEGWIKQAQLLELVVVPMANYRRERVYPLVPPSPNLPTPNAINWYPSLCFFEATDVSVGRGTDFPFEVYGAPWWDDSSFSFVPKSKVGAVNPPHNASTCYGVDLRGEEGLFGIDWRPIWDAANRYKLGANSALKSNSGKFYRNFLNLLSGNASLGKALDEGWSIQEFRDSYRTDLLRYENIRKKYLLYEPPSDPFWNMQGHRHCVPTDPFYDSKRIQVSFKTCEYVRSQR